MISPAIPAAHLLWPIIDLTDPRAQIGLAGAAVHKHLAQSLGFGTVADDRAGAVGFDQAYLRRRHLGRGISPLQGPELAFGAGAVSPLSRPSLDAPMPLITA